LCKGDFVQGAVMRGEVELSSRKTPYVQVYTRMTCVNLMIPPGTIKMR